MTTTAPDASLCRFLQTIFEDSPGFIEFRALPSKARMFFRLGDVTRPSQFIENHLHENVYLGVASRKDASSGDLANCGALSALFMDLDFYKTPERDTRTALQDFPFQPSIIIHSGGGLHCYWLLREPFDLAVEATSAKELLRRLAAHLRGDLAAAEPARILRVPGTKNHKYTPARPVLIETFDETRRYNISDFDDILPEANGTETGFILPHTILEGSRNNTLYRYARSLKAQGAKPNELLIHLHKANRERCTPPLAGAEVEKIGGNAWTQADQPDFGRKAAQPGDGLPALNAGDKQTARLAEATWKAILAANEPPVIFRFGSAPARIERDDRGTPVIRRLTLDRLQHRIERIAWWYALKFVKKTDSFIEIDAQAPLHIARDLLARPEPPLPILTRIVESPIFGHDGVLVTRPGYDRASCVYYAPGNGFTVPDVPRHPTAEDLARARGLLLDDLLVDFPFTGDAERAHTVALLVQPFVRELIPGATPLYLIEKPAPGTGASLLAEVVLFPAIGHPTAAMTEGRDEDEWRKRITSKLLDGPTTVLIDNLRRRLESSALSVAITTPMWEDRRLGYSEIVRLPVRCTWVATGNNPSLSSELTRRTVRIRLDAKQDRPWERSGFKHADLPDWVRTHRHHLVWAALTLGQAWLAAGRPAGERTLGGFEEWSRVVGGALRVAGIPGFLENTKDFYEESDAEGAAWRVFIAAWWEQFAGREVGVSDLWWLLSPEFGDLIDLPIGDGSERSQKSRLGHLLKEMRDRQFGAWRLVRGTEKRGTQRWRLEAADFTDFADFSPPVL